MGKERVSEGLAAGHACHWLKICGDVNVFGLVKQKVPSCTEYKIGFLYCKAKIEKFEISH